MHENAAELLLFWHFAVLEKKGDIFADDPLEKPINAHFFR
jgi:hypothetical protein